MIASDPVCLASLAAPPTLTHPAHRKYKTARFAETFLGIIHEHGVSSWIRVTDPATIKVVKVAGSLTNAVFFVSVPLELAPTPVPPRTLLLRIYGPSSGALISRPRELHTLHVLSSQYRIGPRVWGTFANGRVEEFFESEALTAACLREPSTSRWIGMRMAELHSVDLEAAEGTPHPAEGEGKTWDIAARRNVREWLAPAQEVLSMPCVPSAVAQAFDLAGFMDIWMRYSDWLAAFEHRAGKSPRVFCHNDTQYGNLLRVTHPDKSVSEHRQVRPPGALSAPARCSHIFSADHRRRLRVRVA
jgi:choline kinase